LLKQQALTNLANILSLIEIQFRLEEDYEILNELENQKVNLLEIIKKKSGKESNFKTAENKTISKLQCQFSSLEKSVDQKFTTILKLIENQASNQASNQAFNQASNQASNQANQTNQVKSYTETLQSGIGKEKSQNISSKLAKIQQKQKQVQAYREKRLVIQVTSEEIAKLNSYNLRNQINDRFFQKENISKSVVATAIKSFTE
jgi:hypothetical protein